MKKSKFLKKSLAMLLALMLVVAMIPLSASAALPDDLKYINVNDDQVSVSALEVDMSSSYLDDDNAVVEIDTNDYLGDVELRVYEKGGSVEYKVAPQTPATDSTTNDFPIKDFVDVSADEKTGTMKLALIDTKNPGTGADDKEPLAEYTLTINFVDSNITTNLDVVADTNDGSFGAGIYDAEVKGDEIVVKMARHNNDAATKWDETVQATVAPVLTVKGLDGATIYAVDGVTVPGNPVQYKITDANNGTVITVRSQDSKHDSDYTVVAEYVDALSSFSAEVAEDTVVDATITNEVEKNDNVPDTITLTVPKSVLVDENGDPDVSPELPISYAVNGNVNARDKAKVEMKLDSQKDYVTVKNDGSVKFEMTNLGQKGSNGQYVDLKGSVKVTRFGSFVQEYNLVVKLEDSANTTIEYARVDATVATVDGEAGTITAVLPQNFNGNETNRQSVELVLYTENTVTDVVLSSGTETIPSTSENLEPGQKAWKFTGVDTLTTNATISVYAEDGHFEQYTLSTSMAEATNSASMTAFWLKNGSTTYEGVKTGNKEFTITVPYMTTNTEGWKVYATAGTNAKVVYNGSTQVDIINGVTTTNQIGLANAKLPLTGISTEVVAVNTADDEIFNAYTVKIVLAEKKSAKVLTGLDFTAQSSSTAEKSDKDIYRALNDENQFHAYVDQLNDGTVQLNTINLYVPASLTTHKEDYNNAVEETYYNVVTGYEVPQGAVAYVVVSDAGNVGGGKDYQLARLTSIDQYEDDKVTGDYISNDTNHSTLHNKIVVLPEETARKLETGMLEQSNGVTSPMYMSIADAVKYGTVYTVNIISNDYETDSDLETISVGDAPLNVEGHKITGELPWSYTVSSQELDNATASNGTVDVDFLKKNAKSLTFSVSDYAAMRIYTSNNYYPVYSNGDTNGDGVAEGFTNSNVGFLFVRGATNDVVTVYRVNSNSTVEIESVIVRAEDRLALNDNSSYKVSQTEYTFDLTWKAPSNEAEISNFTVAGRTGTVTNTSETERTITVQVPYGTDLKGMIATFEHSLGSTVKIGSPSGLDFISGTTSLNYTSDVIVYVTSEDGKVQNRYTITVEEGLSFSDVNPGDWFYDNVMDAAENGYVSGMGDGTFQPKKATTRAQFASMIANALGYESDPDAASMFPDVAEDYWGKSAINFCVKNDILKGYDDGTFQPNKAITRQEAASILRNAFKLTESSSETFPDDSAISGWAKESVYIVKASGLMKGDAGTGNFRPTDTIIRAEAASILMNAKYAGLIK